MKRLLVVAAAVASMLGLGAMVAPSAHAASSCDGIRVHLYTGDNTQGLDICLFAGVV